MPHTIQYQQNDETHVSQANINNTIKRMQPKTKYQPNHKTIQHNIKHNQND